MAIISNFAKKFAMVKRPVFKVILFDESWMLGKTEEGVKLYDFLTRMGRSLYSGCIFNGHSVLDLPSEGIKNTISYKFCFQTTNEAEAQRMCEYMGLEPTVTNKETFKNLGNGECMFQDLDGHIGILKFDAVFQDLIDVFSTTPKTKTVELKENPAEAESPERPAEPAEAKTPERPAEPAEAKTPERPAEPAEAETPEKPAEPAENEKPTQTEEDEFDFVFSDEELFRKEEL